LWVVVSSSWTSVGNFGCDRLRRDGLHSGRFELGQAGLRHHFRRAPLALCSALDRVRVWVRQQAHDEAIGEEGGALMRAEFDVVPDLYR